MLTYLPLKDAIKLPIWLYKPKLKGMKGSVKIASDHIYSGMIRLGNYNVDVYPNDGIMWNNHGSITFLGSSKIGNHSGISIGHMGNVKIGINFSATTSLKLICYNKITFGDEVTIGWNCMVCDNDFHYIRNMQTSQDYPITGPISIGHHVWVANNCTMTKKSVIPPFTIVGSHSLINRDYSDIPPYSLLAGLPAEVKKKGFGRSQWVDNTLK